MMTTRTVSGLVAVGALSVFTLASSARAQEAEIPLDQVPKAIKDATDAKFPGAKWRGAAKETEDGQTVYEMSITHKDHKMDVTFKADGTLVLVETEVSQAEVPAAVLQAVKGKYPDAKIDLVESVKKGPEVKKEADHYEFHLTTADKKSIEVEVDSKGKILKSEAGDKD
jgi:uncharacterized membrane protein YkoI